MVVKGRRVLVATDLSENGEAAARAGAELGRILEAEVDVIHVLDLALWRKRKRVDVFKDEKVREKAQGRVIRWFEEVTGMRPKRVLLETGIPEQEIRRAAQEEEVDTLVIGMSGKGAWNKLIFGSTALKLTNPPPCDLVVVHPEGARFEEGMTLGMGTDFSATSDAALKEAVLLAERFRSPLRIVFAHTLPTTTVIDEGDWPDGVGASTTVVNWAQDEMEAYLTRHADLLSEVDVSSHIVTDAPVRGLRGFVSDQGIDWMILGHRRSEDRRGSASVKGKWIQQMNSSTLLVPSDS